MSTAFAHATAHTAPAAAKEAAPSLPLVATRLLLVDDDPLIMGSLSEFLRLEGYTVDTAADGAQAVEMLAANRYNLVLTDVNMPRSNGLELLRNIRSNYPDIVVLVITGYGTIENAVEAVKMGAFEYLTKPIIDDEIRVTIQKALKQQTLLSENYQLKQQLGLRYGLDNIIGHDYKMLKVFDLVEAVADSKTTVLMTGESGTGKSLIARAIHHRSPRKNKAFVEVSCGSIPETLLESELFGHVKGSFTGATYDKQGRFLAADGGTIFLDEINSASPAFQVKLLRVLQERKFEPVGSNTTISVDTRVVLATNQDLAQLVSENKFRQDLYYRINVVNIILPSLRQRLGDIPLLSDSFLAKFNREMSKKIVGFTGEAMDLMRRYTWPGNVRELENAIERAVVLTKRPMIAPDDLPQQLLDAVLPPTPRPGAMPASATGANPFEPWKPTPLKTAIEGPEKQILLAALKANDWNRQLTAEQLDINRTTLYKKMKRYGLDLPDGAEGLMSE
ncbi:MAG TPA: sigma-54 dependent transcriptional regulator [Phycisphaerae bacterium]|nr:sigma-54 dependent transcriptional regulator [Phycisphaerae bacterium]